MRRGKVHINFAGRSAREISKLLVATVTPRPIALVTTLSELGFGLESAAGCSALAFVEGAGVRSVAWTMAVAARDMVYGSSGAELGMVLDAVEDAGFAVKKRYKPHKLYQVD